MESKGRLDTGERVGTSQVMKGPPAWHKETVLLWEERMPVLVLLVPLPLPQKKAIPLNRVKLELPALYLHHPL